MVAGYALFLLTEEVFCVTCQVCREQFVALHKQPILEDLSRQLMELYTPDTARYLMHCKQSSLTCLVWPFKGELH